MSLDEFFALCRIQAQKLGTKWSYARGLIRAYTQEGNSGLCFCPISLGTGNPEDTNYPVKAATEQLRMDRELAMNIVGAADDLGMGSLVRLRERMLMEFGLLTPTQIEDRTT